MTHTASFSLADRALAERLEGTEGRSNAAYVEARAALFPALGAEWRRVAGSYAMFDGVASPITQTFGLGVLGEVTEAGLAELEAFFHDRGADVYHEVSPLADAALLALLSTRAYRPVEHTSVLHRPTAAIGAGADALRAPAAGVAARPLAPGEEALWIETAAGGWGAESPELGAFMREFGLIGTHTRGNVCFLAEHAGEPIAAGAVAMHDGVALLAGASTLPAWRRRGAQAALLAARLAHAAAHGCDLAMMGALPGSTSQQNAERQGFRIAYTRTKWVLPRPA
jgi:GNAT superfamily N-acetyltransferase